MARSRRILGWSAGVVLGLVLLVAVFVLLVGRSEWGTRAVGERAVAYLDGRMAGDLNVDSVSGGGILRGVTLHGIVLEDSLGRPFLRADSARLGYALRSFLGGDVVLSRVQLWRPYVVLERLPGDSVWNFERAFADPEPDTTPGRPEQTDPLVLLERAEVVGATVVLRMPWEPDPNEPVEPGDTADLILEPETGGLVRVMRLEDLNAEFPRLLISSPEGEGRLFRVASLSTRAYVWKTPIELREMGGTVALRDSLLSLDIGRLRLPESRVSGVAQILLEDTLTFDAQLDVDRLSMADMQWFSGDLPREGTLEARVRVQRRADGSTVILARNLDLDAPGTRVRGEFGVILGDTLSFTNVDLRADPLDLDYVGRLVPGGLPVEGLMIGEVRIQGPISSLRTSGNVRLVDRGRTSRVRWQGRVDARRDWSVEDLEATFSNVDPELVALIAPDALDPTGPLSGTLRARGSPGGRLVVTGSLALAGSPDPIGNVEANVTIDGPSARRVDVDLRASDFALAYVTRWVPQLSVLQGRASGPVRLLFDGDSMTLVAELRPQGGGSLALDGVFSREDRGGFTLAGRLDDVAASEIVQALPTTRASGTFGMRAERGSERVRIVADLTEGEFANLPVRSARMHGAVETGVLHVDSAFVVTPAARVAATGSLGVDSTTTGTLRLTAYGDTLAALGPMIGLSDTLLAGSGVFEGTLSGNTHQLRLEGAGRLGVGHISIYAANRATYSGSMDWARGERPSLDFDVRAEEARVSGRRIGRVDLVASIDPELRGRLDLTVTTPFDQRYEVTAAYAFGDTTDVYLERALLADGGQNWRLAGPGLLRMMPTGSRLQSIALVEDGGGRVQAAGYIPWRAPWAPDSIRPARAVDLLGDARDAPLDALVRLVAPETRLSGRATGFLRIEGTADSPTMSAEGRIVDVAYQDVLLDSLKIHLDHRDHASFWRVDAIRDGRDMLRGHLSLPVQVAFVPFRVKRLALPMNGRVVADRMPAALPAGLVSGLEQVRGVVNGDLRLGGTPFDPELGGGFTILDGAFTLAASNVRYTGVSGTLTVTGTQDLGIDVAGATGTGGLRVTGSIRLDVPEDPLFALRLEGSNMLVARRRDVEAVASGYADLTGRFRSPRVEGQLAIVEGTLHLDELIRQAQVVTLSNPLLVDVIDTTQIAVQQLIRRNRSAFLENLSLRVAMRVPGNFWVRSDELNVETAGDVVLAWDPSTHNLQMFGTVVAVRGFYNVALANLPVRRFQVREGAINFVGVPGINPNLDITAAYRARTQNADLLEILAIVDGTMRNPRVRLTSNSDPPISESDLASYLIFGRPTYALSTGEARVLGATGVLGAVSAGFIGAAVPVAFGFAASEIEAVGSELGLFDYFSVSNDETARQLQQTGLVGAFSGTRFEFGRYLTDEWFLAITPQIAGTGTETDSPLTLGGRVEWRFAPSWNAQMFWENRLAHAATRGFDPNLVDQDVLGLFLAREWGY